ncbi:MAG: DNA gyrase subunit A [Candidatus Omnitrophica bacterium]|nr:DNA gyrase subunit A [Candidatus Omnitrophota bacterium]
MEVALDSGERIRCTLDHPFMLRSGRYKNAKDLKPGDSLMPLSVEAYDGKEDANLKGYHRAYQPKYHRWDFVHHLADEWNLRAKIYKKNTGRIRHHLDFDKLNNNPDNIRRIPWREHWGLHKEMAAERHKNDPEYVKKIADGRRRFWADSDNRNKASMAQAKRNRKNWQSPAYRKKMREAIKKAWQNPEYRQRIASASSENLKALWKDQSFQRLLSRTKSKELKERWKDRQYREFISGVTRRMSLELWATPEHRRHMAAKAKERWDDPRSRERQSKITRELWEDPSYRAKYPKDHFKRMADKLWSDPKLRRDLTEKAAKQWNDPGFREKIIAGIIASNRRRLTKEPGMMNRIAQRAVVALRKNWADPAYKDRVVKNKTLRFAKTILDKYGYLTPQIYEAERTNNGVLKFENIQRYFANLEELAEEARRYNHKVVATRVLQKREDVYDLTVDPWHNFALAAGIFVHNSIDGDNAAAMRYTEARMEHVAEWMLMDLEKETVDFVPNFDESMTEPSLLPAALPNLLANGASGIAVGMATNIPPHNLTEVIDGICALIDDPQIDIKGLMKYVKGPDFPTGGIISGVEGIKQAYHTGRGRLKVHAKAAVEEQKGGREFIIISEIPFQVNKTTLIESIAKLVQDKKVEGISDLRDESDKDGMRIVIELRKSANAQVILNQLYKHTQMQVTFGVIMLALVDARPRVLNLKQAMSYYVDHRKDVVVKRTRYLLRKAQERAHILEGLKIALDNLDRIIKTIRASKTPPVAKEALMTKFELSDRQAQAILEMQLQRLTGLERKKIDDEYLELIKKIELYTSILGSEKIILDIVKKELKEVREKFGDERRTAIKAEMKELDIEDLIADEDMVITISHAGYIKRLPVSSYKRQRRGGKGVTGSGMREEDFAEHLFIASTHEYILFFSNKGKAYWLKVHEIPEGGRTTKGKAIINILQVDKEEQITALVPVKEFVEGHYLFMVTKRGAVKRIELTAFSNPRRGGIIACSLDKDDDLIAVKRTDGKREVLIATKGGMAIRFHEKEIRQMGRAARGVRGIRLGKNDEVIGAEVVMPQDTILTVSELGFGKRTHIEDYRKQSRGGKGIKNFKATAKNGAAVGIKTVTDEDELIIITAGGMLVRCSVKDIRTSGRATQGVRAIRLDPKDRVASMAKVVPEDSE